MSSVPVFLPPLLQVAPADAVRADEPVVDEDLVCPLQDFEIVVDDAQEADVGLGGGGEDQGLRPAGGAGAGAQELEVWVAVALAGLLEADCGRCQRRVDRLDEAALGASVWEGCRVDQGFEEAGEPGGAGLEDPELLEQFLRRPVLSVAEHVLVDPGPQARRRRSRPQRHRVVVQVPEPFQCALEPVLAVEQLVEVDRGGQLAPHPARDLDDRSGVPDGVLEGEPLLPADGHLRGVEEALRGLEEAAVVRECLEAGFQALALRACVCRGYR